MEWQSSPYLIPLGITVFSGLGMAYLGWRNRAQSGAISFVLLMLLTAWWSFFYLIEIASVSLDSKLFWIQLQYIGISLSTIFYYRFTLQFIGNAKHASIRRGWFSLWLIVPLLTQFGLWTNSRYQLFYTRVAINNDAGFNMITTSYGPLFWLNTAQSYILLIIATYLLVRHLFKTESSLYRSQINLILIGLGAPWLANILTLTGLSPFENLDLTPFAFTLTGIALGVGLFRYKLLDVMPVARHLLVQQLPEGVMVLDESLRIIDINPAMHDLMTTLPEEPLGVSLETVFSSQPELLKMFAGNENDKFEIDLNGSSYTVHLTMLRANRQQIAGKLAVFIDISKQKEAETYLQSAQTTAEQAKEQADAAEAMAIATAQAKDNFLTTMSHEIRTPINAIVGTGQLLHDTPLSTAQEELLNTIQQSSDALLGLINNILDYSLLEAGNLSLSIQPFSLRRCIENVIQIVNPQASLKNLSLVWDIEPDLPDFFDGDTVRLRQILFNLLHNSIKFSEEGEIKLRVTGKDTAVDQFQLNFLLTDQGIGIPAAKLDQLFQSFHQIDNSLTRSQGGLGLGLAIANRLCRLMGGEINVQSDVDRGSQFSFSIHLPLAKERPSDHQGLDTPSLSGKRLLIISKDQSNRRQLSRDAKSAGMNAYVAGGATDAIYWLQKSDPFDILLLDAALLSRNAHLIGQLQIKSDNVPIILLENGSSPPLSAAQQAQIAGVIHLPLKTSSFYDALHNLFIQLPRGKRLVTQTSPTDRPPLQILLVEDNRINQKVAQNLLKKLGHTEVEIVENGQLALDKVAQKRFDVILMDIQMPVMDGEEATKRIRQDYPSAAQPYIIAVTAHAMKGDREHYLAAGMDDYISKPIKMEKLVAALHQARRYERDLAPTTPPLMVTDAEDAEKDVGPPPIDYAELEMLLGESPEMFLAEIGPEFIKDTEKLLQTLHTALQTQNKEIIQRTAHTLKGTSASLGMQVLNARSSELEQMAKQNDFENAGEKLDEIEQAFADIRPLLPHTGENHA